MIRRVAVACVLVLALTSACSSGKNGNGQNGGASTTTPAVDQGWPAGGVAAMKALAIRLQKSVPGACPDVFLLPHDAVVAAAQRLHLSLPLAVVDCQVSGDTVELNIVASTQARDKYMKERTATLCKAASKAKTNLPALRWVTGANYAIQIRTEGVARNVASRLNGGYAVIACPGFSKVDWDAAAEARVNALAAQMAANPEIKCTGNQLLDRSQYANDPRYSQRMPAAFSQCAAPAGTAIFIAVFNSHTVQPSIFIPNETNIVCQKGPGVAAVQGPDFALIVANVKVAALAAVATHGTVTAPAC